MDEVRSTALKICDKSVNKNRTAYTWHVIFNKTQSSDFTEGLYHGVFLCLYRFTCCHAYGLSDDTFKNPIINFQYQNCLYIYLYLKLFFVLFIKGRFKQVVNLFYRFAMSSSINLSLDADPFNNPGQLHSCHAVIIICVTILTVCMDKSSRLFKQPLYTSLQVLLELQQVLQVFNTHQQLSSFSYTIYK